MRIHFLNRLEGADHDVLGKSVLASDRLRTIPALLAAKSLGWNISSGETVANASDLVVVSKIGEWEIDRRETNWLSEIGLAKKAGAKIALDYTDHHLASASAQSSFYRNALELADQIIVPSDAMRDELRDASEVPISVVEDRLEYAPMPPKAVKEGANTALWFGHQSNLLFLANYLEHWPARALNKTLLVVCVAGGDALLREYLTGKKIHLSIRYVPWSISSLALAARQADVVVIPSDLTSHKKYASSNRLVTSLALGLPTVATPLPSYVEFEGCFANLGKARGDATIVNPEQGLDGVRRFQEHYMPRFSDQNIIRNWRETFTASLS